MASINNSHHSDGGVVLFAGELILLYCDAVHCDVKSHGHAKGRIYLTTHRIIFTANPINQNPNLKSISAPFFLMFDLSLEQPIFGANYIKGKVRGPNVFCFELKFNKGGAIEFGQAMFTAAKHAENFARQTNFQPPPTYTSAASGFYQAPQGAYQPSYPVGFTLPTQIFNEAPPPGFIYATQEPPPYPGLVNQSANTTSNFFPGNNPNNFFQNTNSLSFSGYNNQNPNPNVPAPNFNPQGTYQSSYYPNIHGNNPAPGFFDANFQSAPQEHPPSYDEATKKKQ